VYHPLRKLVQTPHVVVVGMGGHRRQRAFEKRPGGVGEARDAEPAVDQQIPVAAPQVPDIAADQRIHMGFGNERHAVAEGADLEPALGDPHGAVSGIRASFSSAATTSSLSATVPK